MGYGFYEPRIVYGFYEKNQTKLISYDFLEKYDIERYALYTNKGSCFGFIYGKSCESIENMGTIDTVHVDTIFDYVSKYGEYVTPRFMLALSGNLTSEYGEYNPEKNV